MNEDIYSPNLHYLHFGLGVSGADGISRVLAAYIHELCVGGVQQFMGNVAETGPPGWDTADVKSTERGGEEDRSEWDVCTTFLVLPAVLLGRVGNESHTQRTYHGMAAMLRTLHTVFPVILMLTFCGSYFIILFCKWKLRPRKASTLAQITLVSFGAKSGAQGCLMSPFRASTAYNSGSFMRVQRCCIHVP